MARVAGKVALVTGGAGGLGCATVRRLAEEGAIAVVADLDDGAGTALAKEIGGDYVRLDVTSEDQWRAAIATVRSKHGRIDVLVNAAGIEGDVINGSIETASLAEWHKVLGINLDGTFLGCKHVIPVMEKQGGGAIVNVASTSGIRFTGSPQVGYAATKAGVIQLSRVVAVQYAPKGIRVNTVVPGQLHTPMVEARLANQRAGGDVKALLAQRQKRIPLPVEGDGRDTANAVLFLASDEARFVTGTEIVVDGGMSVRCD